MGAILEAVHQTWPVANDLEITLEANPTSVEAARFDGFRSAGVNRISMGIQALSDPDLQALGRLHSAKEALSAFDIARQAFDRVSFDLMYGRQHQTLKAWENELSSALSLSLDHLSLYQLTIEEDTAFGDRYKAGTLRGLPDEDLSAEFYDLTQDICAAHGMSRYEVSNHATDGNESRHNLIYWRYGDYVGIGPGAHGRLTIDGKRFATEQTRMPAAWLSGATRETRDVLNGSEQASEFLLMGLRLTEGVDKTRFENLSGSPLCEQKIADLVEMGLLMATENRISVTFQGFKVLNGVLRLLLSD